MTFLSPSSLLFLFAVGIPIAIHILNQISSKKVDFSSIRFIKSLENNAIRNVKFKKLVLLLLRIGFIASIVLMLSRPVTKGFMPGWISAELESRLLLVIDNSSSMSGKVNSMTLLESAKDAAKDVSQIFNNNTIINIVQTCPPQTLYTGKISDPSVPLIIDKIKFPTIRKMIIGEIIILKITYNDTFFYWLRRFHCIGQGINNFPYIIIFYSLIDFINN